VCLPGRAGLDGPLQLRAAAPDLLIVAIEEHQHKVAVTSLAGASRDRSRFSRGSLAKNNVA
jgi:hypothetical protein